MTRQNQREMKIIPIRKIYQLNEEQQDIYLQFSQRKELTTRKDIVLTAQTFVLEQVQHTDVCPGAGPRKSKQSRKSSSKFAVLSEIHCLANQLCEE